MIEKEAWECLGEMAGVIEKKNPRFTTKITYVPGPSRTRILISLTEDIKKILQQGPTKVLWKFRAIPPQKQRENHRLKTHYTFVGEPFLKGTFFCHVFF
jgi:hypothetical protein